MNTDNVLRFPGSAAHEAPLPQDTELGCNTLPPGHVTAIALEAINLRLRMRTSPEIAHKLTALRHDVVTIVDRLQPSDRLDYPGVDSHALHKMAEMTFALLKADTNAATTRLLFPDKSFLANATPPKKA